MVTNNPVNIVRLTDDEVTTIRTALACYMHQQRATAQEWRKDALSKPQEGRALPEQYASEAATREADAAKLLSKLRGLK